MELIYQIESIEGNKYYIRKIDDFNEYLISEDDIDRNDYRWKNFKLSNIERMFALGEVLGLLCFVVSGIFLVIYVIEDVWRAFFDEIKDIRLIQKYRK